MSRLAAIFLVIAFFISPHASALLSNSDVCMRTFTRLLEGKYLSPTPIGDLIHDIRQLRLHIDPQASPSYSSVTACESSDRSTQVKAAARMRGLEVFGLKIGPGAEKLSPEDRTLGLVIEGPDKIKAFLKEIAEMKSIPTLDYMARFEKHLIASVLGTGVGVSGAIMTQNYAPLTLPLVFNAWTMMHLNSKNDFKEFSEHVLNSIESNQKDNWAHYGRKTRIPHQEYLVRKNSIKGTPFDRVSTAGSDDSLLIKMYFKKTGTKMQDVLTDYSFYFENGQPRLYVFTRIPDANAPKPPTRDKDSILEKAKQAVKTPLPVPAFAPAPVPIPKP